VCRGRKDLSEGYGVCGILLQLPEDGDFVVIYDPENEKSDYVKGLLSCHLANSIPLQGDERQTGYRTERVGWNRRFQRAGKSEVNTGTVAKKKIEYHELWTDHELMVL
jgi:hypothetical protein